MEGSLFFLRCCPFVSPDDGCVAWLKATHSLSSLHPENSQNFRMLACVGGPVEFCDVAHFGFQIPRCSSVKARSAACPARTLAIMVFCYRLGANML
jgi:hypothetical protein